MRLSCYTSVWDITANVDICAPVDNSIGLVHLPNNYLCMPAMVSGPDTLLQGDDASGPYCISNGGRDGGWTESSTETGGFGGGAEVCADSRIFQACLIDGARAIS